MELRFRTEVDESNKRLNINILCKNCKIGIYKYTNRKSVKQYTTYFHACHICTNTESFYEIYPASIPIEKGEI